MVVFWEILATIFAGLGAAGLVLTFRLITRIKIPKWVFPFVAGIGMFTFQIYSEYTWFEHQKSRLPEGAEVIRAAEESSFWRPWSYFFPQTMRFIAADFANAEPSDYDPDLMRLNLYVFKRRQPAQPVPQLIHCAAQARADYSDDMVLPERGEPLSGQWYPLDANDLLLKACAGR